MGTLKSLINLQTLNSLFNQLAIQQNNVFWVRSIDFQKQLYVSPNYENLWERDCETLYKNPADWEHAIIKEERNQTVNQFLDWLLPLLQNNASNLQYQDMVAYFKIKTNSGKIFQIKDWCFPIYLDNQPTAIAGIAECLHEENHTGINHKPLHNSRILDLQEILSQEVNFDFQPTEKSLDIMSIKIRVSKELGVNLANREIECIYHLCKGLSAKQTSKLMNLSSRTVEHYLVNSRKKLRCANQALLISLLSRFYIEYL